MFASVLQAISVEASVLVSVLTSDISPVHAAPLQVTDVWRVLSPEAAVHCVLVNVC